MTKLISSPKLKEFMKKMRETPDSSDLPKLKIPKRLRRELQEECIKTLMKEGEIWEAKQND